jgi:hypothetical protein
MVINMNIQKLNILNQDLIIICHIHGEFLQKPNGHLGKKKEFCSPS